MNNSHALNSVYGAVISFIPNLKRNTIEICLIMELRILPCNKQFDIHVVIRYHYNLSNNIELILLFFLMIILIFRKKLIGNWREKLKSKQDLVLVRSY